MLNGCTAYTLTGCTAYMLTGCTAYMLTGCTASMFTGCTAYMLTGCTASMLTGFVPNVSQKSREKITTENAQDRKQNYKKANALTRQKPLGNRHS